MGRVDVSWVGTAFSTGQTLHYQSCCANNPRFCWLNGLSFDCLHGWIPLVLVWFLNFHEFSQSISLPLIPILRILNTDNTKMNRSNAKPWFLENILIAPYQFPIIIWVYLNWGSPLFVDLSLFTYYKCTFGCFPYLSLYLKLQSQLSMYVSTHFLGA